MHLSLSPHYHQASIRGSVGSFSHFNGKYNAACCSIISVKATDTDGNLTDPIIVNWDYSQWGSLVSVIEWIHFPFFCF